MPREVFVAGQILTAAEMNIVSDQTVMVFAGAAARGSAIPSPTEGMVTYRSDDDVVEVFDGSAFVAVGSDPGLVEVKSAIFTGTQSASVAGGANVAVTDLSITHTLANSANKLIISAHLGAASTSVSNGNVGIVLADGATFIGVGDAAGSRSRVGAGGFVSANNANYIVTMPSVTFVYEPGDTASHTYTVRAVNIDITTRTLTINRAQDDSDSGFRARASSALVIQEVSV